MESIEDIILLGQKYKKSLEKKSQWQRDNKDKTKKYRDKYYYNNRERILEEMRAKYLATHPRKIPMTKEQIRERARLKRIAKREAMASVNE